VPRLSALLPLANATTSPTSHTQCHLLTLALTLLLFCVQFALITLAPH